MKHHRNHEIWFALARFGLEIVGFLGLNRFELIQKGLPPFWMLLKKILHYLCLATMIFLAKGNRKWEKKTKNGKVEVFHIGKGVACLFELDCKKYMPSFHPD
jgi:ubiquinone biosynthesis protein Coq4